MGQLVRFHLIVQNFNEVLIDISIIVFKLIINYYILIPESNQSFTNNIKDYQKVSFFIILFYSQIYIFYLSSN